MDDKQAAITALNIKKTRADGDDTERPLQSTAMSLTKVEINDPKSAIAKRFTNIQRGGVAEEGPEKEATARTNDHAGVLSSI